MESVSASPNPCFFLSPSLTQVCYLYLLSLSPFSANLEKGITSGQKVLSIAFREKPPRSSEKRGTQRGDGKSHAWAGVGSWEECQKGGPGSLAVLKQ